MFKKEMSNHLFDTLSEEFTDLLYFKECSLGKSHGTRKVNNTGCKLSHYKYNFLAETFHLAF